MNKNEIKKALYKEKPHAEFLKEENNHLVYRAELNLSIEDAVYFNIPKNESQNFDRKIPAQLLIRWLV